ncbi:hypothetical protein CAOG_03159 [Capsaspora owczarzaki ATCC 30864]|uniref:hypothetical protein n=1 Tax=Capsaspora owczarzaki (strain ATCC 30864) TaxID=595528 RepID=UPI0001FE6EA0|nr:hypothetical protein CAOG_03159 [Capsaspora owczarzaki ATCC 30864]|eukprot:XP_004363998.1 hypothetical protein CAOG_03159 [Capsaspora owczarzaki ATCC 30864]
MKPAAGVLRTLCFRAAGIRLAEVTPIATNNATTDQRSFFGAHRTLDVSAHFEDRVPQDCRQYKKLHHQIHNLPLSGVCPCLNCTKFAIKQWSFGNGNFEKLSPSSFYRHATQCSYATVADVIQAYPEMRQRFETHFREEQTVPMAVDSTPPTPPLHTSEPAAMAVDDHGDDYDDGFGDVHVADHGDAPQAPLGADDDEYESDFELDVEATDEADDTPNNATVNDPSETSEEATAAPGAAEPGAAKNKGPTPRATRTAAAYLQLLQFLNDIKIKGKVTKDIFTQLLTGIHNVQMSTQLRLRARS